MLMDSVPGGIRPLHPGRRQPTAPSTISPTHPHRALAAPRAPCVRGAPPPASLGRPFSHYALDDYLYLILGSRAAPPCGACPRLRSGVGAIRLRHLLLTCTCSSRYTLLSYPLTHTRTPLCGTVAVRYRERKVGLARAAAGGSSRSLQASSCTRMRDALGAATPASTRRAPGGLGGRAPSRDASPERSGRS